MKHYICPYCEANLRDWEEEYCPDCRAVLSLSKREMQLERVRLLQNEARRAIANEEWRLAINNLVTILMMDPENSQVRAMLQSARRSERLARSYLEGELHLRARRWQKALASLEKVERIDPDFKNVAGLIEEVKQAEQQDRIEQRKKKKPAEPLIRIFVGLLMAAFTLVMLIGLGLLIYNALI